MPMKAAKACSYPGCPNLVRSTKTSYCEKHERERQQKKNAERPSKRSQGYDKRWRRISASYLRAHPFCEMCGKPAEVTHHKIRKKEGGTDSIANLQALCRACHARLHAEAGDRWEIPTYK